MPYDVEYISDGKYIVATFRGEMTEVEFRTARSEMNAQLSANDCRLLLVDASGVSKMLSIAFDFEFTAEHGSTLPPGTRHAVVIRPQHKDHMQFVEDVARNRSVDLRLFLDRDHAVDWLLNAAKKNSA